MSLKSLQDLYIEELKDIYSAEKQILQALPKMAKAASNEELQLAFKNHLEVTKDQVTRLETIFEDLERRPQGKKCQGMAGLVEEGKEMMEEDGDPDVKDAALIASAQRIEHYEISAYGTVRTFAKELGFDNHVKLLQKTLDEEGQTDKLLSGMAVKGVNRRAQS
ncbi:MAG TPA: ferritin-like domain-containing protein [Longimicrobiales bacterium]